MYYWKTLNWLERRLLIFSLFVTISFILDSFDDPRLYFVSCFNGFNEYGITDTSCSYFHFYFLWKHQCLDGWMDGWMWNQLPFNHVDINFLYKNNEKKMILLVPCPSLAVYSPPVSNVQITLFHYHYMGPEFTFSWAEALLQGSVLAWTDLTLFRAVSHRTLDRAEAKVSPVLGAFVCVYMSRSQGCGFRRWWRRALPCIYYSPPPHAFYQCWIIQGH